MDRAYCCGIALSGRLLALHVCSGMTWLGGLDWQRFGRSAVALFWVAVFFLLLANAGNDDGQNAAIIGLILFLMGLAIGAKHTPLSTNRES